MNNRNNIFALDFLKNEAIGNGFDKKVVSRLLNKNYEMNCVWFWLNENGNITDNFNFIISALRSYPSKEISEIKRSGKSDQLSLFLQAVMISREKSDKSDYIRILLASLIEFKFPIHLKGFRAIMVSICNVVLDRDDVDSKLVNKIFSEFKKSPIFSKYMKSKKKKVKANKKLLLGRFSRG